MMTKKEKRNKLVALLGERFGDDPQALIAVHKAIERDFQARMATEVAIVRSEIVQAHKDEIEALRIRFEETLMQSVSSITQKMEDRIRATREDVAHETETKIEPVRNKGGTLSERLDALDALFTSRHSKMNALFEGIRKKVERFSEFAVGAPNRSFYMNGTLPSVYFSDTNLVAGTGITLTASSNMVKNTADITISASSGGITVETPSGTVNASNTVFTPIKRPLWVVSDSATYYENNGYTWDGTNINMTVAPSEYIRDIIN